MPPLFGLIAEKINIRLYAESQKYPHHIRNLLNVDFRLHYVSDFFDMSTI